MKLTELRCPNCGANLSFTMVFNGKIKCEYCESSFEYEESKSEETTKADEMYKEYTRRAAEIRSNFSENVANPEENRGIATRVSIALLAFLVCSFTLVAILSSTEAGNTVHERFDINEMLSNSISHDYDNITYIPVNVDEMYADFKERLHLTRNEAIYTILECKGTVDWTDEDDVDWYRDLVKSYVEDLDYIMEDAEDCFGSAYKDQVIWLHEIRKELEGEIWETSGLDY